MKHFKGIVYSDVEPSHDFLWIKPLENNLNDFYLYDKGWEKIDNSSKAITEINKSLERLDEIIILGNKYKLNAKEIQFISTKRNNFYYNYFRFTASHLIY